MPNRLHAPPERAAAARRLARWRARAGAVPGLDRLLSHGARAVFTPERGLRLSARGEPRRARPLRHAFADVPGNSNLARSWAKCARALAARARRRSCSTSTRACDMPVLLLWADRDPLHPLRGRRRGARAAARRPAARARRAPAS